MPTQQQEFERIAMPHLAALLRVARRLTLNPTSAEDLVQESMVLAWRGFRGFQTGANVRAWLFRILFNAFHGEARKPVPEAMSSNSVNARQQESVKISERLQHCRSNREPCSYCV